jgi:phosphinothricin acetyltransferase
MRSRLSTYLETHPWIVCEHNHSILGYAYASEHRSRWAYQWATDVSIYIAENYRGRGLGRALYTSLFELLKLQNFYHIYAGITLPNPGSVGLHEAMGFEPVGVYKSVGYKMGRWHDVGWWHLPLRALPSGPPQAPLEFSRVRQRPEWSEALQIGLVDLKL